MTARIAHPRFTADALETEAMTNATSPDPSRSNGPRSWSVALATIAFGLGGCTVGPDHRPRTAAELGMPERYSVPAAPDREDLTRWWTRFDDPVLGRLVEQAGLANLDIAQAVGRLRQAREGLLQSRSNLLPTISGSAGYNRSLNLVGGGTAVTLPDGSITTITRSAGGNFSAGLDARYQVGLFGEIRRTVESTRAQYEAAGFDQAAVLLTVQSEVARNYILARGLQAQIANARSSLLLQDDNLEIAGFRVRAGLVSSLDSEQARQQRAQTAAAIPQLDQQLNAALSRLGVLTAQAPGALKPELSAPRPIPTGPRTVSAGVPADTLRRRPDIRAAERQLAAATAEIGVAQAALYPALALTGNINTNAASLGGLGDAITGALFAGVTQAIFNGGRLRSQVRSARAGADIAFASYRATVLLALEDVENALAALASAQAREREFSIALDAATNFATLSRSQYRAGLTDFTTLAQAEAALFNALSGATQARADAATATVQLFSALGGGWDAAVTPVAPDQTGIR